MCNSVLLLTVELLHTFIVAVVCLCCVRDRGNYRAGKNPSTIPVEKCMCVVAELSGGENAPTIPGESALCPTADGTYCTPLMCNMCIHSIFEYTALFAPALRLHRHRCCDPEPRKLPTLVIIVEARLSSVVVTTLQKRNISTLPPRPQYY